MILGGTVSASALAAVMSACQTENSPVPSSIRVLPSEQFRTLQLVSDITIPRTETPGAVDVGVDRFIDSLLAEYFSPENRTAFLNGFDHFIQAAHQYLSQSFTTASPENQLRFVEYIDRAAFPIEGDMSAPGSGTQEASFFADLKQLIVAGYYTSEAGATEELHIAPYGEYRGDVPYETVGKTWA